MPMTKPMTEREVVMAGKGVGSLGVAITWSIHSPGSHAHWFAVASACLYFSWWHAVTERREGLYRLGEFVTALWWGLLLLGVRGPHPPAASWAPEVTVAILYSAIALMDGIRAWRELRLWWTQPAEVESWAPQDSQQ